MHWRRFAIKDIPKDSTEFEAWVLARWREKDDMVEYYMQNGRFPADGGEYIETGLKPEHPLEFLQIFVPSAMIGVLIHLTRTLWAWLLVALNIRAKS
jgi:lysocardiolipin and lysophospholipid acyltransferase